MSAGRDFMRFLEERFGLHKGIFSKFSFHETSDKVYVLSVDIPGVDLSGLRVFSIGITAGRQFDKSARYKPTTNLLQIFGKFATRNIVDITDEEKEDYMRGLDIEKEADVEEGYVIVRHGKDILGCGLYSKGSIKNQVPKAKRMALR
ncbi:MAG: hypothetical protein JW727_00300 [Candidatus Aenigmarchaeota archaeon]|nr:hypothetical protein [Candidatus Aenigmarchaeota archaeon]